MTSDRPTAPNRDRSTLITAIVCGVLVVSGAIAAVELSRRLALETKTSDGTRITGDRTELHRLNGYNTQASDPDRTPEC